MKTIILAAALLAAATAASPAFAGASNFSLVNGTSGALGSLSIRRVGTNDWRPLGSAPGPGGRGAISFSDPDCAFDIRATVGGTVWSGVNLCGATSVTLKRDAATGPWVDYD